MESSISFQVDCFWPFLHLALQEYCPTQDSYSFELCQSSARFLVRFCNVPSRVARGLLSDAAVPFSDALPQSPLGASVRPGHHPPDGIYGPWPPPPPSDPLSASQLWARSVYPVRTGIPVRLSGMVDRSPFISASHRGSSCLPARVSYICSSQRLVFVLHASARAGNIVPQIEQLAHVPWGPELRTLILGDFGVFDDPEPVYDALARASASLASLEHVFVNDTSFDDVQAGW